MALRTGTGRRLKALGPTAVTVRTPGFGAASVASAEGLRGFVCFVPERNDDAASSSASLRSSLEEALSPRRARGALREAGAAADGPHQPDGLHALEAAPG